MKIHLLLAGLAIGASALYEDQVGKFDWRQQYVGCPTQVQIDRRGKLDRYIVSTAENVVASLSMNTGDIVWRKVQEDVGNKEPKHPLVFSGQKNVICSVSESGKMVRLWAKRDGGFVGQQLLGTVESSHAPFVTTTADTCLVLSHNRAIALSLKDASKLWEVELRKSDWVAARAFDGGFAIVGGLKENNEVHVKWVDTKGMQTLNKILDVNAFNPQKVAFTGSHLVGFWDSTVYALNILSDGPDMKIEAKGVAETVFETFALTSENFVAIRTKSRVHVLDVIKGFSKVFSLPSEAEAVSEYVNKEGKRFLASVHGNRLSLYQVDGDKELLKDVVFDSELKRAPAKQLIIGGGDKEWEFLVIGADCRTDHVVADITVKKAALEWTREEGLTRIGSVELLDLPLSESQAAIETEFAVDEKNILASFAHRIFSQLDQFKKLIARSADTALELALNMKQMKSGSFSDLLNSVRQSARKSHSGGQPLERDVFNLRKLIVATSLGGSIYALDNQDGTVVWRRYIGADIQGFETIEGKTKIPILVQRTTAFYNFDAQIVVAYKRNGIGHLLFLNPVNGKEVDHQTVDNARRIDLLPFVDGDHLHHVITVDRTNQVSIYPKLSADAIEKAPPVHLFDVNSVNGKVTGYRLDLTTNRLTETWAHQLPHWEDSTVVAIAGKPASERTHSQGRVLADRSVLYKYVNPNLIAVGLLAKSAPQLNIHLFDSVTGQIVHSARLPKVTAPVYMVHCENWVAYAYWTEKGRRTEIGILELFEGDEQQHVETFDSEEPLKRPLHVEQASFIFSQGISSMAVTETEQGASNRAILVSLPFGNIFEVNRRILDPLRPMELTPEMREEGGFIPYMPEIPIATEEMLNYNQTVHHVNGIKTAPSGLESTSLVFVYGLDLFYTRATPSGNFDVLKDDFDHILICIVLAALFIGSYVCRKLARNKALQQQWA
ncbi:unnamed protein product, partial [Mesorhabditis spiculigera]